MGRTLEAPCAVDQNWFKLTGSKARMRVLAPIKVLAGAAEEEVELGRADEDEGTEADEEVTGEATAVVGAGASLEMTGALLGVATLAIELETTASVLAATALAEDEKCFPVCLHRPRSP